MPYSTLTHHPLPADDNNGFTLIELSIVIVIIGLIAGGILVGRDLISAAGARAQISQIEKYQQAVNTFRGKYGYLPGDIPTAEANKFGLAARGDFWGGAPLQGGDGNGILDNTAMFGGSANYIFSCGEAAVLWIDLSQTKLIDSRIVTPSYILAHCGNYVSGSALDSFFPKAKINSNSYVYAWSGGYGISSTPYAPDANNYFALSALPNNVTVNTSLTVNQAYAIDKKTDDGLPQHGNVLAMYPNQYGLESSQTYTSNWAASGALDSTYGQMNGGGCGTTSYTNYTCGPLETSIDGFTVPADDTTCYDNNNDSSAVAKYSTAWKNGTLTNCALSFKFQ